MVSVASVPISACPYGPEFSPAVGVETLLDGSAGVPHLRQAADVALHAVIGQLQHQISRADKPGENQGGVLLGEKPEIRQPLALVSSGAPPADCSNAGLMLWLVSTLEDTGRQFNEQSLNANLNLYREARKSQQDLFEKSAKEIEDRANSVKKVTDAMGCAAKIFGGVLVTLSVVAGVLTGGAALVLAGVGLGLMVADYATEAITGKSLTGMILNPVINSVFSPMAKFVGDLIAKGLVALGVDADTASIVGAALGAVIIVVALIALAFFAKGAVSKVASAFTNIVKKMMGRLVTKTAQNLAGKAGQSAMAKVAQSSVGTTVKTGAGQVAKNSSSAMQWLKEFQASDFSTRGILYAQRAMLVSTAGNTGLQASGRAYVGFEEMYISDEFAKQVEIELQREIFQNLVSNAVKTWVGINGRLQGQLIKGLESIRNETSVATFVAANMRAQGA